MNQQSSAASKPSQPLSVTRVLLVEDDPGARTMIARYLTRQGYEVTAVDSAERALVPESDAIARDVVISDVHLPGMSGVDLAGLLLERSPMQPIVLITGDPDEALARDALSRGPVSYLLKPFELFELAAAVNQAMTRQAKARRTLEPAAAAAGSSEGPLPLEWLKHIDESSYAGVGHADRVARIARVLSVGLPRTEPDIDPAELTVAAWSHEIGRLQGATADPSTIASRGATMLTGMGCANGVERAVRHLHERWDGQGGPDGLVGPQIPIAAQVLAVADSIDHYCASWLQAGLDAMSAVDRALGLIVAQQGTVFSPVIARAAMRDRAVIHRICGRQLPATEAADPAPGEVAA
jgi:response regulator RpfG family c-di-GMP phosphodiesterase